MFISWVFKSLNIKKLWPSKSICIIASSSVIGGSILNPFLFLITLSSLSQATYSSILSNLMLSFFLFLFISWVLYFLSCLYNLSYTKSIAEYKSSLDSSALIITPSLANIVTSIFWCFFLTSIFIFTSVSSLIYFSNLNNVFSIFSLIDLFYKLIIPRKFLKLQSFLLLNFLII